jgi:hypothetical protein
MRRVFLILSLFGLAFGLCLRIPAQTSIGTTPGWLRYLGNGMGGNYTCSTTCTITDEHWFSSFNIPAGATAFVKSGNGPIIIRSTGPCTLAGTLGNTPNIGFSAGISVQGDFGGGGGGGGAGATNRGHVGPWTVGNGWVNLVSGGTAGFVPAGKGGPGATPVNTQYRSLLSAGSFWPAGGSLGGAGGGPAGGQPGNAGGPIILVCESINFTGTIDVRGGPGSPPTANNSGAGGGGGAGYVILSASSYVANSGVVKLAGGPGGSCGAFTGCGAGGAGGNGWNIAITIE